MPRPLRIATVNVNGIRAAFRKGMGDWLEASGADIVAMQEVRAATEDVETLLGPEWDILHDAATAKGRAGVAIASRHRAHIHRVSLGADDFDSAGRWLEADYDVDGTILTVVSTYVHSGSEKDEAKQAEKYTFLDAMEERLPQLQHHNERAIVLGDLNVGHTQLDIKNWKGNLKHAGFLPRERAYFDRFFGPRGETVTGTDGSEGIGLGWVDVGRRLSGDVEGPWTWWSMRGKAYDTDTGWRLDYHVATPALADTASNYRIDRAPSWDTRWSDHAPVTVDYAL